MNPSRTPRYLFVTLWDPIGPGGVNQVVANLYEQMRSSASLRPLLMVSEWGARTPRATRIGRFAAIRLRMRAPQFDSRTALSALVALLALPMLLIRLRGIVRAHDIAVVNAHYPSLAMLGWAAMKRLGLFRGRLIFSLHGLDIRTAMTRTGLERRLWSWMLAQGDCTVACSDGLAQETRAGFPASAHKVATVHNGVETAAIERAAHSGSTRAAAPLAPRLLLNLGTYESKKGQDVLLRAYASVAPQFPDTQLVIAGRSTPTETFATLTALVEELGLQGRVRLLKDLAHADAAALLRDCEIFLLPSRNEGFAVVLLEAGALVRPVIATAICGVEELIVQERDGIVVPPDDPAALAQALRRLLSNPQDAARMAQSLHQRVSGEFTWGRALERYLAIVDESDRKASAGRAGEGRAVSTG